jgi:hypothetical protein
MLVVEDVRVEQPEKTARQAPPNIAAMMLCFMGMTTDKGEI